MKRVVVVGCPRSGTRRLQTEFGLNKVDAAHEADADLTVSCFLSVDADTFPVAHAPWWDREVDEVWHQVRHPLATIPSIAANIAASFWVWQSEFTGLHPRNFENRRFLAAIFWHDWNRHAEQRRPDYRFRIEDLESEWPVMWQRLGLGDAPPLNPRAVDYPNKHATRKRHDHAELAARMTWDEVKSWGPSIHDRLRRMADSYGYEE